MKMLINVPETVVADALRGMAAAHPELAVDVENRVIVRRDAPVAGKVGLVSGGGSRARAAARRVRRARACWTRPVPARCSPPRCRTRWCAPRPPSTAAPGVLFVVKNYTGDVLNFEMAAELAEDEGVQIAKVLVNDDVAVTDSLFTAGRRGTGATLFVEKIAGAAAEEGAPLERVEARRPAGERGVAQLRGGARAPCTTPAKGGPTFDLPAGELELGVGIHGEPGRERRAMMTSREIADCRGGRGRWRTCDPTGPVLALVNGMGATPLLELYGFNAEVQPGAGRARRRRWPVRSSATT